MKTYTNDEGVTFNLVKQEFNVPMCQGCAFEEDAHECSSSPNCYNLDQKFIFIWRKA